MWQFTELVSAPQLVLSDVVVLAGPGGVVVNVTHHV